MCEEEVKKIADNADMIVEGYAFTRKDGFITVLNLRNTGSAMVMDNNGIMLETNMNEIEQALVERIWKINAE